MLDVSEVGSELGRRFVWRSNWNIADLLRAADAEELGPLPDPRPDARQDWTETCELALRAADTIRRNQSRIEQLEADNAELELGLTSQVRALAVRIRFLETLAARAEAARVAA